MYRTIRAVSAIRTGRRRQRDDDADPKGGSRFGQRARGIGRAQRYPVQPGASVSTDEDAGPLGGGPATARMSPTGVPSSTSNTPGRVHRPGHRHQRGAGRIGCSQPAEPSRTVTGDEGHLRQCLDVVHQCRTPARPRAAPICPPAERGAPCRWPSQLTRADSSPGHVAGRGTGQEDPRRAQARPPSARRWRASIDARPVGPVVGHADHDLGAPMAVAATSAPSSTRWGAQVRRIRSLALAGSPSMPLTTSTGRAPPRPRLRHLTAAGKPGSPPSEQSRSGDRLGSSHRPIPDRSRPGRVSAPWVAR